MTMQSTNSPLEGEVVPFGKYRDRPVEHMLADGSYLQWLLAQPWFRERYVSLHQLVVMGGNEPQDSPEHNEMQLRFLEKDWSLRLANLLYPARTLAEIVPAGIQKAFRAAKAEGATLNRRRPILDGVSFEDDGWDLVINCRSAAAVVRLTPASEAKDFGLEHRKIFVELKPDLGDDFPNVLRQMKGYMLRSHSSGPGSRTVLLVRRARFEHVSLDQVVSFFAAEGIHLVLEEELAKAPSTH